jgi:hypothetical protein
MIIDSEIFVHMNLIVLPHGRSVSCEVYIRAIGQYVRVSSE